MHNKTPACEVILLHQENMKAKWLQDVSLLASAFKMIRRFSINYRYTKQREEDFSGRMIMQVGLNALTTETVDIGGLIFTASFMVPV